MRTALLRLAEMVALKLADTILVATGEFGRLFAEDYHIPDDRIIVVPVGVDFERFTRSEAVRGDLGVFRVAYWGGFHPHHGVEVILEAAALLKDREEIEFILAGVGSLQPRFREKAEAMALANVRFAGYLTDEALIDVIAEADVCLGVFSTHVLARCSVTNKVFQAMSMSQPVITEDSPAVRAWFEHREHLYLVRPEDPAALSQAILVLQSDTELRRGLGKRARQHLERSFSVHAIGEVLLNELNLLDVAPGEAS